MSDGGKEGGGRILTNILLADLLLLKFGQSCISFPLRKQRCISSVCVCVCVCSPVSCTCPVQWLVFEWCPSVVLSQLAQ